MVETFLSLLEKVIMLEGEPTKGQINIIENVRNEFKRMKKKSLGWKN